MSKSLNNPTDQWMIKSANRVMGPFKLIEVITGLHLKHFTVMDEIASPFGRWILIRDEQSLQAAVKDIRNRADVNEHTATQTQTMTASMSMNSSDTMGNGDMPPPIPGSLNPNLIKDPKVLAKMQRRSSSSGLVIGILIALIGIGAFLFINNKKKGKDPSQDLFAQALQLKERGFYDKALLQLNKLKAVDRENPKLDLEISIFQIILQNQNIVGRKTLEKNIPNLSPKDGLEQAHTAIALSYLNENDYKNSSESLNKALVADPTFVPALINRALLSFRMGDFEKSEKDFEPVIGQINNGVVVLGSTLASLEVSRKGVMPMRILPVLLQTLDDYLKNNFEYQQEAYLLKAYIYNDLGKTQQRHEAITDLLNSDLESGQGHRYDLLVDRSVLSWKSLLPYCQGAIETSPKDPLSRSLGAYCQLKAGNDLEAKKIILEAEMEAPRNPYVAAMKAFIMRSLGQDPEAKASLSIALTQSELLSAKILRAKYCEAERDEACVKEALNQVLDVNPRSLPAYLGLAKQELRLGHKKEANDWIGRGQNLSLTFIPFWELKASL